MHALTLRKLAPIKDNAVSLSDLLQLLLGEDSNQKVSALAIMRDKYGLYSKESNEMVDYLRHVHSESPFAFHIRELLFELKGPFTRKEHNYYDITEDEVVKAINSLGYQHEVAKRLREYSDKEEGIFKNVAIEVRIKMGKRTILGNTPVCLNSEFAGRDLMLIDASNPFNPLPIFAKASPCMTTKAGTMYIAGEIVEAGILYLHADDAKKLFGSDYLKTERQALMYLAPRGYASKLPQSAGIES